MKIVVINQHTENYGDDAAGVAMSMQIRDIFPNAEIHYLYNTPHVLEKGIPFDGENIYHHLDIIFKKKNLIDSIMYVISKKIPFKYNKESSIIKTVNLIKEADYVLVSPCGANIGIYKDWYFLLRVLIAVLEKKSPIFHLNTVGSSGNKIFDFISKWVLKRSKLYVRETKSYNYLNSIGLYSELGVDTAFSLPDNKKSKADKDYIAFIPTELSNWHVNFKNTDIDNKVMDMLINNLPNFCKDNNVKLKIIPHLTGGLGERELLENYKVKFIKSGFRESDIEILDVATFNDYEEYIINSRYTISMRYHGIIFAIKNSIPFLSLSYENKMNESCNYSGMSEYNVDLNKFEENDFKKKLKLILANEKEIKTILLSKRELLRRLSSLPIQSLYMEEMKKRMEGN